MAALPLSSDAAAAAAPEGRVLLGVLGVLLPAVAAMSLLVVLARVMFWLAMLSRSAVRVATWKEAEPQRQRSSTDTYVHWQKVQPT